MFIVVALAIWLVLLTHVFLRTRGLLGLGRRSSLALGVAMLLLGLAYVLARVALARDWGEGLARPLELAGAWYSGIVALQWTLLVALELVAALVWLLRRKRLRRASRGRRRALGLVWLAATAGLTILGARDGAATPGLTHLELRVPGVEARRLVFLADMHLGLISDTDQWRRTLEAAREQAPDALLIPGDLIEDHSSRTAPQLAMLREFFPDEPIWVTTGNHEFYAGGEPFAELCAELDLRLLRQDVEPLIEGLDVAGIDDLHFVQAREALDELLPRLSGPTILLTHRPAAAHLLRDRPQTLVLAGHTHGGQTLPMVFLVPLGNAGFRAGRYGVGAAELYVTRGSGTWGPPLRILAPPELVLIEVRPGDTWELLP